ncbi:hypothetical protein [Microbacterium phyllosphaerae]|uniref:hypothetical protein n=1 Tax=Microbacterium phyllosphaerae TaxID=124798 RepID=UPI0011AE6061|nr:hypothetical protein [Microbacterium phyllosphaerae]
MTREHDNHSWRQAPPPPFYDEVIKEGKVRENKAHGQLTITYQGPCPCCLGQTVSVTPLTVIPSDDQGIRGQSAGEPFTVTMECACLTVHPNTPEGMRGCGHEWEVTVR